MFQNEKHILVSEDITTLTTLSNLTILRHCRGERFSPTLGKDFPAPICSGPGNKLKWMTADINEWLEAKRTSKKTHEGQKEATPPGKRKRGRPKNVDKFVGWEGGEK